MVTHLAYKGSQHGDVTFTRDDVYQSVYITTRAFRTSGVVSPATIFDCISHRDNTCQKKFLPPRTSFVHQISPTLWNRVLLTIVQFGYSEVKAPNYPLALHCALVNSCTSSFNVHASAGKGVFFVPVLVRVPSVRNSPLNLCLKLRTLSARQSFYNILKRNSFKLYLMLASCCLKFK